MPREIKFRGKRVANSDWLCGFYLSYMDYEKHFIVTTPCHHGYLLINTFEVDPATVGQLVRKGSESRFDIYAGDILKDDWGYKYVIEWDEQDTVYRARDIITGELDTLHGKWAIGTEHDNPELLEVE